MSAAARPEVAPSLFSIAIAGATGLVGAECVRVFSADPGFSPVTTLVRRPSAGASIVRVTERVVDYERLEATADALRVTHILCALGTTLKAAGSREAFAHVDRDYVVALATLGAQQGAHHFLVVSATGANPKARAFYNRVKGSMEDAIRSLPYHSITIVRPSLLLGDRDEFRAFELVGKVVGAVVPGRYRPVHAHSVANALHIAAREDRPGLRIIESEDIRRMAR